MIARLPGWSWDVRGGGVTLVPPEGRRAGAVRYVERLRPLRPVDAILRDKAGDTPGVTFGPIEPVVTAEGEYAAVVDVHGTMNGAPVQRTMGYVFADDWYSEVAVLALQPDQFARFAKIGRDVVRQVRLMLGVRRRRYVYRPPAGWHGYERLPQFVSWFSPRYPADPTSITVYPAIPVAPGQEVHFGMLPIGPPVSAEVIDELAPPSEARTAKLFGAAWDLDIHDEHRRRLARRVVLVRDQRYLYTAYLDAAMGELAARAPLLDELLASIEPIPTPALGAEPVAQLGVFDHYL